MIRSWRESVKRKPPRFSSRVLVRGGYVRGQVSVAAMRRSEFPAD